MQVQVLATKKEWYYYKIISRKKQNVRQHYSFYKKWIIFPNITKVSKLATIPENDAFKLVNLKETGKKKNEASFFRDEMERYNLNKANEAIKKQQEVYSEVEVKKSNNNMELGDLSEVEIKKNNKVSDKNDFFNNMMK